MKSGDGKKLDTFISLQHAINAPPPEHRSVTTSARLGALQEFCGWLEVERERTP